MLNNASVMPNMMVYKSETKILQMFSESSEQVNVLVTCTQMIATMEVVSRLWIVRHSQAVTFNFADEKSPKFLLCSLQLERNTENLCCCGLLL